MRKNYDLYSPYQRTIDNLKRRIRGYEKMKKDLTNQYRKTNKENQELKKQNQKYKDVFDKVEEYIKKRINSCTAEANSTTNDTMCRITIIGLKHLLDILKEVE